MNNLLISIIIPVKNGENYLAEAIENLKKQEMDMEIIVVDDASNDNTAQIAERLGCKVIRHETNRGQVVGKNTGIMAASGKFILFHDHDDIMRPGALKMLYEAFDDNVDAVMAKVKDFCTPEMAEADKQTAGVKPEPYYGLFTGAVLIRKSVFDTIGPFSESIIAGEIMEWSDRMAANSFVIKKIDFVSTDRRVHNTNYGKTNREREFKDYAAVLRAKLLAKRTNGAK